MARGHVGALLTPLFETQAEDVDVEREEEEDAGDGEGGDVDSADCGPEAAVRDRKHVEEGKEGRRREGGVRGGRGVD